MALLFSYGNGLSFSSISSKGCIQNEWEIFLKWKLVRRKLNLFPRGKVKTAPNCSPMGLQFRLDFCFVRQKPNLLFPPLPMPKKSIQSETFACPGSSRRRLNELAIWQTETFARRKRMRCFPLASDVLPTPLCLSIRHLVYNFERCTTSVCNLTLMEIEIPYMPHVSWHVSCLLRHI